MAWKNYMGVRNMKEEYENFKVTRFVPGAQIDCLLNRPIPCTNEYFVHAFWMPIKHQIGEKLVFSLQLDMRNFSLIFNRVAIGIDDDIINNSQMELILEEAEKVFTVAMDHIDRIVEHIYCKKKNGDTIPFIDELRPITSVDGDTITLNGRLPMQEAYFIKKYWKKIVDQHHQQSKGVRFKIHFAELSTKISVSAELCRYDAICAKRGLPRRDASETESYQIQIIMCDLTDAIVEAAFEYAESCRRQAAKNR